MTLYLKSSLYDRSHFFQVWITKKELVHLERSKVARDGGVEEDRGGSGRIRGRRFIWALEGSHITFPSCLMPTPTQKRPPHPPATISKPLPPEPEEAVPEASIPVALEAPSSAGSQALKVAIPAHMTSLCLQLGTSNWSIHARLRSAVRGCPPHGLLSAHMCTGTMWE